jgi:DNA helicase-2/ATP-dependent DNA helicase PcrA
MTLHNAKGLEFPVVYLTGLEEGLFPLARARDNPATLEEERRLFYVGITRAEDVLVITHARMRRRNGETMPSMRSSFLKEMPAALVPEQATLRLRGSGHYFDRPTAAERRPGTPVERRSSAWIDEQEISQDAPRFVKSERVKHPRFGSGTIVELSGFGRETKVTVDFDDETVGRKRLVVRFAGLERGDD